jgi:hypothetical protein
VSAHRESFAHRARNLLPLSAIWDFPIPNCSDCGEQMVKLENQWGCRQCSAIQVLRPTGALTFVRGRFVPELKLETVPLIDAYPNRAARRSIRR